MRHGIAAVEREVLRARRRIAAWVCGAAEIERASAVREVSEAGEIEAGLRREIEALGEIVRRERVARAAAEGRLVTMEERLRDRIAESMQRLGITVGAGR